MTALPPSFAPDPQRRRHPSSTEGETHTPLPNSGARVHRSPSPEPSRGTPSSSLPPSSPSNSEASAPASFSPQRRSLRQRPTYTEQESSQQLPARSSNRSSGDHTASPTRPTSSQQAGGQPPSFAPARMREQALPNAATPHERQEHSTRSLDSAHPRQAQPRQAHPSRPAAHTHSKRQTRPSSSFDQAVAPQWHQPRPSTPATRQQPRRFRRYLGAAVVLLLIATIAWPLFLYMDTNANLGRVDALSGAPDTPGTTYLLAGSDSRADGPIHDDTEGQRSDSVMLLHIAPNGQTTAISLPRDTWVDIPEYGEDKLNASYGLEGPPLLVRTVEGLTGLTVDHYVEVGMGGVANIVDAVGGVELCLDYDVSDELSELEWTAGCHNADGRTALAFSRMRYSDPMGDIGRAERQRQVVTTTVKTALSPSTLLWPPSALALERAGAGALRVDRASGAWDILNMVRAFRTAGNDGMTGAPPIENLAFETYSGSAVLLQDSTAPDFFNKLRAGTLQKEDLNQTP